MIDYDGLLKRIESGTTTVDDAAAVRRIVEERAALKKTCEFGGDQSPLSGSELLRDVAKYVDKAPRYYRYTALWMRRMADGIEAALALCARNEGASDGN